MMKSGDDSDSWDRLWDVFHAALDQRPEDRASFLNGACSDPATRREIEELLRAHESDARLDRSPLADLNRESGVATATVSESFHPGDVLAGRFEVVQLVGEGGMGSVYEARDRELGTTVALKTLRSEIASEAAALERFRREISLSQRVTHPNVCRIFDLFRHHAHDPRDADVVFVTMELLRGETLADRLRREGPFSPAGALPIVGQIAGALSAAHRAGVVHRDLKTSNGTVGQSPASPRLTRTNLDSRWDQAILKCVAQNPVDRFQDADQVVGALKGNGAASQTRTDIAVASGRRSLSPFFC